MTRTLIKLAILAVFISAIIGIVVTCNNCSNRTQTQYVPVEHHDYGNYRLVTTGSTQVVIIRDGVSEIYIPYDRWQSIGYDGAIREYRNRSANPNWESEQSRYRQILEQSPSEYKPSSGFTKPTQPNSDNNYKPTTGFVKQPATATDGYTPTTGFVKPPPNEYKPSSAFKRTGAEAEYKSSSGFRRNNQPEYKESSGFRSQTNGNSEYRPTTGFQKQPPPEYKPSTGFKRKE